MPEEKCEKVESRCLKRLRDYLLEIKDVPYIPLFLYQFEELNEEDFKSLKEISSILKIRACDPGELALALFKKKEVEHYTLQFTLTEETIESMFTDGWRGEYYTILI